MVSWLLLAEPSARRCNKGEDGKGSEGFPGVSSLRVHGSSPVQSKRCGSPPIWVALKSRPPTRELQTSAFTSAQLGRKPQPFSELPGHHNPVDSTGGRQHTLGDGMGTPGTSPSVPQQPYSPVHSVMYSLLQWAQAYHLHGPHNPK